MRMGITQMFSLTTSQSYEAERGKAMSFLSGLKTEYDVVICGAGAAGLTLARQLALEVPEASVLLIEGVGDKSRTNAIQVGESTVEMSAHYLSNVVKLKDYLET